MDSPLTNELEAAGLAVQRWRTDDAGDFAVLLASATQGGNASRDPALV